ncbi:MAG TPA: AbrB/MazE/SpoVT family DNA-binding domain-containing protein [Methanobacterium sp.]|nr:AbrB/MazE/SpoVT family DNA-binding domain-containing protein [Methanobacterium sp.]
MITKLQKWGNSQGVRIPKEILSKISISEGDSVDVSYEGNVIIIKRIQPLKRYSLEELFKNNEVQVEEEYWGSPEGKEEW